ncbi:MAG: hypothetical protein FWD85_09065 [Microbacteriaceae bacterium]|nr:hypothetical protein [Microbacteriaceae bacterium]MCL2795441.1 hypothetical protein [Microbacteriaceae bacterium]
MPRPSNAPQPLRLALAPGFLGAIVVMAGLALIGSTAWSWIEWSVAILAAITGWFAVQGKVWWAVVALAAILVIWNPVWPLPLPAIALQGLSIAAAATFIAAGVLVKVTPKE